MILSPFGLILAFDLLSFSSSLAITSSKVSSTISSFSSSCSLVYRLKILFSILKIWSCNSSSWFTYCTHSVHNLFPHLLSEELIAAFLNQHLQSVDWIFSLSCVFRYPHLHFTESLISSWMLMTVLSLVK